ncbi:3-phosphoshikimate 1-carboxyvinyltransferase [Alkalispirillum mobile]|uniref:3-phosphoshikimate 1-carboxyvinyltransferase n=1 Tax=Alkalispirillum mobile TaxID=85925 RepID=A0A498C0S6_9GAMM|nr:3-phosphoshikimate 1-carboxyvinyltransferase [Alkalispirillum mobile]RLK48699.1 3-phosphoshikimate 1-carboxyvinyltransferase [Alkalispirillum mobile]
MEFHVQPGGALRGRLRVPGDKSISHRAIMLGALADGATCISGFLEGEDALATLRCFRAMGVDIDGPHQGRVTVQGVGLRGLQAPGAPLELGNSGTSMRLLCGLLAGQSFDATLTGDHSLSRRPMRRVIDPLTAMGAVIESAGAGTAPLTVRGGQPLHGIDYELPVASAQVKSALLLAGLYASGRTCVTEPAPTRDHTERMLSGFGYRVERDGSRVCVEGGGRLQGGEIEVPADISSAAFFLVGASIAEGSDMTLEHVGMNPTRTGVVDILRLMGADIQVQNERVVGGEPVADLRVRSAPLKGIAIPEHLVPLAIDEFPALFIAAACAEGETLLTGAEELRVKESDRIAVMADGLNTLGVTAEPRPDGMRIVGQPEWGGGRVHSHSDHRIAMAFTMAATRARDVIHIEDCDNVNTSFPGFVELTREAGVAVARQ